MMMIMVVSLLLGLGLGVGMDSTEPTLRLLAVGRSEMLMAAFSESSALLQAFEIPVVRSVVLSEVAVL